MATRFETYGWQQARRELTDPWRQLVRLTRANPSLDPEWMEAVVASHGFSDRAQVVAMFRDDELIGVLPLLRTRASTYGIPVATVDFCSNHAAYHPDLVASAEHEQLLRAALGGRWDLLRVSNVPVDSEIARLVEKIAAEPGHTLITQPGEESPYLQTDLPWEQFLKTRNTKFRSNFTRVVRRAKEAGETEMLWFEGSGDPQRLLELIIDVEKRSWKSEAGVAIAGDATETDYYARLLPMLARREALFANVLMVGDRPAAYVLCCRIDGWIGQLKTSFDAKVAHVGARVSDESVKHAIEVGGGVYDFLGAATPHKLKWTDTIRSHRSFWLYAPTLRGRLVGALKKWAAGRRRPQGEVKAAETEAES